jgi:hypothetical protein
MVEAPVRRNIYREQSGERVVARPYQCAIRRDTLKRVRTFSLLRCWVCLLLLICLLPVGAQEDMPDAVVAQIDISLRLRATPEENAEIVGYLPPDTPLSVLSRTGDDLWLEVRSDTGDSGWVDADFIKLNVALDDVTVNPAYTVPYDVAALVSGVTRHVRLIYERGQQMGSRAHVFSKVGDSITVATHTLNPIGEGLYDLGAYTYLQPVIDAYSATLARTHNSFMNQPLAANIGWTTTLLLDPQAAPPPCQFEENALECEYRIVRPSVALILLGTNDVETLSPGAFKMNLSRIVEISLDWGVIPVLTTIPPRPGFEAAIARLNTTIKEVSRAYAVPLVDYYTALAGLPELGLDVDRVHPNIPPLGYAGSANFRTANLDYGYVMRNLTLLQALYEIEKVISESP